MCASLAKCSAAKRLQLHASGHGKDSSGSASTCLRHYLSTGFRGFSATRCDSGLMILNAEILHSMSVLWRRLRRSHAQAEQEC